MIPEAWRIVEADVAELFTVISLALKVPEDDTVTAQVAVFPPSTVVTVIVAVPTPTAVTSPEELTVATDVSLEDQVTLLLVAVVGFIVAASCVVPPVFNVIAVLLSDTLLTGILLPVTVTVQVAVLLLPSVAAAVMVQVPAALA